MPRFRTIRCKCCDLVQRVREPDDLDAVVELCPACFEHRGSNNEMQIRRHSEHADMLRGRLAAASQWAERAEAERDDVRDRMRQAYSSRERAVRYLQRINNMHSMRGDGSCSCGVRRNCRVAALIYEKWPQSMIAKLDRIDEERERELRALTPERGDDWLTEAWDQLFDADGELLRRPRDTA